MGILTDWDEHFSRNLMSPDEAIALIPNGAAVALPPATAVPTLGAALMRRADDLRDIDLYIPAPVQDPGWFEPGHPNIAVHIESFNTAVSRRAYWEHRIDYTTWLLSYRFKAENEGRSNPAHHHDVALLSVSPPDQFGFCSFGLSMWSKLQYARQAKLVIAEVNSAHPRTFGDNRIHVSEINAFVMADPADSQRGGMAMGGEVRPLDPGIVGGVNHLIHNGDTFQIGTGDRTALLCVAGTFDDKEDLGYHAELCVAGTNDLVRKGIITGKYKTLHPGKFVATQLAANTPEDIAFIHENPVYEVYDVSHTNNPLVIAQHDNMVAINNALAIDFSGQINAESIDGKHWSGPGGQPEFAMGAYFSKGGRNITVIEATAKNGEISRIMPTLPPGTIITVPNYFADYVVTEFGIASLLGKSHRERADELISVAHPDHRAELRRQASRMFSSE